MQSVVEILQAKDPKPIGTINGRPVYGFQDGKLVANKALALEKNGEKKIEYGDRPVNRDGQTYKHTESVALCINPELYYLNRYRKIKQNGKTIYEIVIDYRAIKEQASGKVYTNSILVYQLGQEKGELELLGTKMIDDIEFMNEFKSHLSVEAMQKVADVLREKPIEQEGDSLDFR